MIPTRKMRWFMCLSISLFFAASLQVTNGELDLESILKQITPEAEEDLTATASFKNVERSRRDGISDELRAVINNVPTAQQGEKITEKRDSDTEDNKKFSVVKIPDNAAANKTVATQPQTVKLNTVPAKNDSLAEASESDDSSGSGADSDSESGSSDGSESGSGKSDTVDDSPKNSSFSAKKSDAPPTISKKEATLAMNIEDSLMDEASGSGSGSDSDESGSGSAESESDSEVTGSKRNIMDTTPQNQTISNVTAANATTTTSNTTATAINSTTTAANATDQRVTVALPSPVSVGNVSKVVTINPGGFNETPMAKEEKLNSTEGNTLNEIKYFKPQENSTSTSEINDKVNLNNNQTRLNAENSTFLNIVTGAVNQSLSQNKDNASTSTKTGTKKNTLPEEVSNVADNLFNFENDDEESKETISTSQSANVKALAKSDDNEDSLPGSQGGPIGEDLMSSITSPQASSKRSSVPAAGATTTATATSPLQASESVAKKWKVISSDDAPEEDSTSNSNEVRMEVESSIGKTFDASMRKTPNNMEAELLPGDYGDDALSLSDLSGSGSGEESGDSTVDEESGSGEGEILDNGLDKKETIIVPKSAPVRKNSTGAVIEPETEMTTGDSESGDSSESGSGSGSGSGSADFESLVPDQNEGEAESSPYGLHAIEAASDGDVSAGRKAPLKSFRQNMTTPTNFSLHTYGEPELDNQPFTADADSSDDSESGSSGDGGEGESGDEEDAVSGDASSGSTVDDESFAQPKPLARNEENALTKDQVGRLDTQESPDERSKTPDKTPDNNSDADEATVEDVKSEDEEIKPAPTHKRHHLHHHHHHQHHHNKHHHHHHHHKAEGEEEEDTEGQCTDRQNCPGGPAPAPARSRYTNPNTFPQQGDIVTEEFLEHLMVSQLLEQNVNLFYTNMAGRPGEQGEAGDKGSGGNAGEPGMNGYPGAPGEAGSIGASGNAGLKGIGGPPGFPGAKGDYGDAGEEGLKGPPGAPGPPGVPGGQENALTRSLEVGGGGRYPNCSYACEGEKAWLQCQTYEAIKVLRVFWGREEDQLGPSAQICSKPPLGMKTHIPCESDNEIFYKKVKTQCQNRPACELVASKIFFDDNDCEETYKYLKVCYECAYDESNAVDVLKLKKRRKRKIKRGSEHDFFDNRHKRSLWDSGEDNWKHPIHQARRSRDRFF